MDGDAESKTVLMTREELRVNEKLTNEEYKIWKKGAPFMYNALLVRALQWPSLTAQWLPGSTPGQTDQFDTYQLLLGTHTSKNDKEYLQFGSVDLPNSKYTGSVENKAKVAKLEITQQIAHEGEVNTARYNPHDVNSIATGTTAGDVLVFDRSKSEITHRLKHHQGDVYSLSWSPFSSNELVSSAEDKTVAVWDVANGEPTVLRDHTGPVYDLDYSRKLPGVFGTASEDTNALIYDRRDLKSAVMTAAHDSSVNSISFNPFSETVFATGSSDTSVGIWDLRNLKQRVHSLKAHAGDVTHVQWSPHDESVIASAAFDRRVNIWDLSLVNSETADDNEGPPELQFVHAGHTNKISDFSWNPTVPWTIATASEDNVVQVWQMAHQIADKEDEDDSEGQEVNGD